jgi:hypothetical protein
LYSCCCVLFEAVESIFLVGSLCVISLDNFVKLTIWLDARTYGTRSTILLVHPSGRSRNQTQPNVCFQLYILYI